MSEWPGVTNASAGWPGSAPGAEPAPDDAGLVEVFLVNATRTSSGRTGPGLVRVSPQEASRLIAQRLAMPGPNPPRHWPG
jgi:hypothetical protein